MNVIVETDEDNATLIAVLRLLAGGGVKPIRVVSKEIAGTPRIAHRIETTISENVDVEIDTLARAIEGLKGVASAKIDHSA